MPIKVAIGIDLGTTYSSVAIVNELGIPSVVPNLKSERLTPSVVQFEDETIIVGQTAKDSFGENPENTVMFAKRKIGTDWYFDYQGRRYSSVDISALILKKLVADAAVQLGQPVDYAVITVPAYFDDDRRSLTKMAAKLAGLEVLALLNEPTAAGIAFGLEKAKRDETVLVYDLGGGTFDVTVVSVRDQQIQTIASSGHHELGGKDFDDAIMGFVAEQFAAEHGFDPTKDVYISAELRTKAEKAKRDLSEKSSTVVMLHADGKRTRVTLTREQFTELIKLRLNTTMSVVRSTLSDAKLRTSDIDRVLLVGGSTRIFSVRESLKNLFGKDPDYSINPDEAVALGAAVFAAKKLSETEPESVVPAVIDRVGGLTITDVTSHSLGIEASRPGTVEMFHSILIRRNSPLPASQSRVFETNMSGQTAIKLAVYQGEFEDLRRCRAIGVFTLSGLPPRPPGQKIRITMTCNSDGIVSINAVDIATGIEATSTVDYQVAQAERQNLSAKEKFLRSQNIS
jgi:molecular chaperone DnaK